jgi:hypothetical protein
MRLRNQAATWWPASGFIDVDERKNGSERRRRWRRAQSPIAIRSRYHAARSPQAGIELEARNTRWLQETE